jgi:glycosyltransferase involved in cell wall biosynthesis
MPAVVTVFGLAPRYIGGSENYARELSLQLDALGWKSVICFLTPPPDDVRSYLDLPNVTIEVLEEANSSQPKLATIRKLSNILKRHQAKVLHLHLVGFVGLYPWVAKLRSVDRVFFTHHMSHPEGYVPKRSPFWKRRIVRVINWPLTGVICVSDYNLRSITGLDLIPTKRFTRIYNGVDLSRVPPNDGEAGKAFRKKHGIDEKRTVITQVSWIIAEKGVGDVLEAARIVVSKNPDTHFVFVGEGEARQGFMSQAVEMGLGDHITWTGLVQDPFGEGVYAATDIVCQASRWEEAFGQVIAEAMACGKPVVGTRSGGIPEVIADGKSGYVVERGDYKALAERILQLAANKNLREEMGNAGQEMVRFQFDLRHLVKQVIDLYGIAQADGMTSVNKESTSERAIQDKRSWA